MKIKKEIVILTIIAILAIGFVAVLIRNGGRTVLPGQAADPKYLVHDNSHMTGSKNAKVTVVEFGDYQCPACGVVHPTLKQILSTYQDNPDFNFVFRNFPLPMHQNALMAAEAAEAAGEQGKFWQMHDRLYETQNAWADQADPIDLWVGYAQQLGLDVHTFKQAVQQNKFSGMIQTDQDDGNALGVHATPTFFIDGREQVGTLDFMTFKNLIDTDLKNN